jgi:CIC family chloride channel protein
MLLLALAVGLAGGLVAVGFRWAAAQSARWFASLDGTTGAAALAAVMAIPALGGLGAGVLLRGKGAAREPVRGPQDFVSAVRPAGLGVAARRLLATVLTVASGGSAGGEGAVAQAGGGVGAWLGGRLGLAPYRLQVIGACGIAASLSGLMQAPFAGCLLAAEIILGGYAVRSIVALALASFSAAFLARSLLPPGAGVLGEFELVTPWELAAYLGVGIACGLVALLLMFMVNRTVRLRERFRLPAWARPAVGGLLVAAIALAWPQVRGAGYVALGEVINDALAPAVLVALLLAKTAATALTIGSGGAGGLLTPSLLVGASAGSLVGVVMNQLWPHATGERHSYAIVGMSALMAATMRAPLTSIVLATELSGNYLVAMPATIAVVAAVFMTSALHDEGTRAVRKRGAPSRDSAALHERRVGELTRRMLDTVRTDTAIAEVVRALRASRHDLLVVLEAGESGRVVGVVKLEDMKPLLGKETEPAGTAAEVMVTCPVMQQADTLAQALAALTRTGLSALPVVDDRGALQGVLTRDDVMQVCAQHLLAGYVGGGGAPEVPEPRKELTPQSHEVFAVPVPRPFAGRTLREIDLVRRWGVACVGMRRATETGQLEPVALDNSKPLRAGDVLILIGERANVERVKQLDHASELPEA